VLATLGIATSFWVNVGLLTVGILATSQIRLPSSARPTSRSAAQGLVAGFRYALTQVSVRTLLILIAGVALLGHSHHHLMALFARDVLDVGPTGLGWMLTAPAAGTIVAGLTLGTIGNLSQKGRWLLRLLAVYGVVLLAFAAADHLGLALAMLFVVGATHTAATSLAHTLLQETTEDRMRGRVMGFYMAATQGIGSLGALPGGVLAQLFGAPIAVGLGALGVLLLVFLLAVPTTILRRLD
jgi:predicted MFS family arabinose efflux permease